MYATVPTAVPGLVSSASAAIRRHRRRAGADTHALGSELRQVEIEDLDLAAARYKNIRWLDVAMNDAFRVRGIERVGNLNPQVEHLVECERLLADAVLQRLAFEQLHGDEGDCFAAIIAIIHYVDFIDGADVGVIQRRGRALRVEIVREWRDPLRILQAETLALPGGLVCCPRPCRPHPYRRRRAFRGSRSAKGFSRSFYGDAARYKCRRC
jgi:hypothetical protein